MPNGHLNLSEHTAPLHLANNLSFSEHFRILNRKQYHHGNGSNFFKNLVCRSSDEAHLLPHKYQALSAELQKHLRTMGVQTAPRHQLELQEISEKKECCNPQRSSRKVNSDNSTTTSHQRLPRGSCQLLFPNNHSMWPP